MGSCFKEGACHPFIHWFLTPLELLITGGPRVPLKEAGYLFPCIVKWYLVPLDFFVCFLICMKTGIKNEGIIETLSVWLDHFRKQGHLL